MKAEYKYGNVTDDIWTMTPIKINPFCSGKLEGNNRYRITLTGNLDKKMERVNFTFWLNLPLIEIDGEMIKEPPYPILTSGEHTINQGNFRLVMTGTIDKYFEVLNPRKDNLEFTLTNMSHWPAGTKEWDVLATITNFNMVIEKM